MKSKRSLKGTNKKNLATVSKRVIRASAWSGAALLCLL